MGPETVADADVPGSPPDEEREVLGEGHRVAPKRADGPVIDEVAPLIPPERDRP